MDTVTNKKGRLPLKNTVTTKKQRQSFKEVWGLHKEKYFLIAPFAILFIIFNLIPVLMAMVLSFTNFNMLETPDFIGLANYIQLLAYDEVFLIAVKNTLLLAFVTGPVGYFMCFIFAWLINELPPKPRAFLTLVFYAPALSGGMWTIWTLLFSSDAYGYINAWLIQFGIIDKPIMWFQDSAYIMPLLIIIQLWASLGVSFLAFIAGLQTVDKTLYEAGAMDGVKNRWQELWYITLPSMKPQLMFGAVMQITGSLSIADGPTTLAGGANSIDYAAHTILTHLNDYGNVKFEMGYASAIAVILFFVMIFANILVQKMLRRVGE